jgi:hypothetical protein
MDVILFKGYYFNKCLIWLYSIGILISAVIFLVFNFAIEYRYFICMIFIFTGIMIVFYLNRFEPASIKFSNEKIEVSYFNKFFFKKNQGIYSKDEIKILNKEDIFTLSNNTGIVAIIRKKALDAEDWGTFKKYLN